METYTVRVSEDYYKYVEVEAESEEEACEKAFYGEGKEVGCKIVGLETEVI